MTRTLKSLAAASMAVAAVSSVGCGINRAERPGLEDRYHNVVDPCWPQRYSSVARDEVLAPFATQAENGSVIAHTVWNYHFENGSDKLTPAGVEALDTMIRQRPAPDGNVYLQTARDIAYEQDKADKFAADRGALDAKRIAAVQKYLSVQPAAKSTTFNVAVVDPADPAFYARYPVNAIQQLPGQYRPTLNSGGGGAGGGGQGGGTR
jgi:hypothetical protein